MILLLYLLNGFVFKILSGDIFLNILSIDGINLIKNWEILIICK